MDGFDTVLIVDFGSKAARRLARLSRECGAYSEIIRCDASLDELARVKPKAVLFGGVEPGISPSRFVDFIPPLFSLGVPVLACGEGVTLLERTLYSSASMSEDIAPIDAGRKAYTSRGEPTKDELCEFLECCGLELIWSVERWAERFSGSVAAHVKGYKAVMRVDSSAASIAAMRLMEREIGEPLELVYVDNGLGLEGEAESLRAMLMGLCGFTVIDSRARMLDRLKGAADAKIRIKRALMEDERVLNEHLASSGARFFISFDTYDAPKRHRLYDEKRFTGIELLEPLKPLFSYEAETLAEGKRRLPLPEGGYAAYFMSEINAAALELLRKADAVWVGELESLPAAKKLCGYAVCAAINSAGEPIIALRAESGLPDAPLMEAARRAAQEIAGKGASYVYFDLLSKGLNK